MEYNRGINRASTLKKIEQDHPRVVQMTHGKMA